ncbi:hypothetical protein ACFL4H_00790 [Candidatus Neomarinimicrobiota bacterium]
MKYLKNYKAHWIFNNGNAILSKNTTIYKYNFEANSFAKIKKLRYNSATLQFINRGIIERLLREGIHHVLFIKGSYIVFFNSKIITISSLKLKSIYNIRTCKKPLNVCYNPLNNAIYWGDYIATNKALPINIYCSKDNGKNWDIVYTFSLGTIRHIHNIIFDPFNNNYLILTGDKDKESGIWKTKDFTKVEPVLIGKQSYRAISLIPQKTGLIIPTDTELRKNLIQSYSYSSKKIQTLLELTSSAADARRVNNISFVSTMYEPSKINRIKKVKLYCSRDNKNWFTFLSLNKDILPSKYFQYPLISIPHYNMEYSNNLYYFNTRCVKGGNGVMIYSKNEISKVMQ